MKKIVIIIIIELIFILSTCAIVVNALLPAIWFFGLLRPQPVDNKKEVLTYYEKNKNIILPKESIDVKYYEDFDPKYVIDFKIKNKLKTKYILEEDDEIRSQNIPKKLYLRGLREYIIDNLLYDKSKGNHFDKIEEYLQKNRERIFKIFLSDPNDKGVRIYFDMDIMYKLPNGELYWQDQRSRINNYIIESLGEYGNENYVENKEKGFFKEKVKYEDIDWGKYIEYMEVYPVLYMNVEYKYNDDISNKEIFSNQKKSEKLLEIYKEMEKFYNKKTFNFAIREW